MDKKSENFHVDSITTFWVRFCGIWYAVRVCLSDELHDHFVWSCPYSGKKNYRSDFCNKIADPSEKKPKQQQKTSLGLDVWTSTGVWFTWLKVLSSSPFFSKSKCWEVCTRESVRQRAGTCCFQVHVNVILDLCCQSHWSGGQFVHFSLLLSLSLSLSHTLSHTHTHTLSLSLSLSLTHTHTHIGFRFSINKREKVAKLAGVNARAFSFSFAHGLGTGKHLVRTEKESREKMQDRVGFVFLFFFNGRQRCARPVPPRERCAQWPVKDSHSSLALHSRPEWPALC